MIILLYFCITSYFSDKVLTFLCFLKYGGFGDAYAHFDSLLDNGFYNGV